MAIVLQKPTAEHVVKEESYAAFPLKSRKAKTRMPIIITFIHHHLLLLPRKIARRKRTNGILVAVFINFENKILC